jgi:hypothetical protein
MIVPAIAFSQSDPKVSFKNQLVALFQDMDKSRITSGLLADYSVELAEIAPFNGIPSDTNYVDASIWLNLYSSIYDAKINDRINLENPETVANRFKNASRSNSVVPLAIMHYEYDKLDDDALKKGLVTYSGNRIQDIRGKPSPYIKKNLFAIAPQSLVFEGKEVAFVFRSDLLFGNIAKNISKIEINFNNESGYRTLPGNSPLSYTFSSESLETLTDKFKNAN